MLLHDGETGELRALLNASAITEIRTAAVSAVATRALARADARVVAILGGGVQARSHAEAMRAVLDGAEIRDLDSRATAARPRTSLRGADVVCTCTSAREPILAPRLARAGNARERGRLERPDDAASSTPRRWRRRASSSTGASRP